MRPVLAGAVARLDRRSVDCCGSRLYQPVRRPLARLDSRPHRLHSPLPVPLLCCRGAASDGGSRRRRGGVGSRKGEEAGLPWQEE